MTVKLRLTEDCEHGEKGKVIEADEGKVAEFLAQGRCELVPDEPEPAQPVAEAVPVAEPPKLALPKSKGRR